MRISLLNNEHHKKTCINSFIFCKFKNCNFKRHCKFKKISIIRFLGFSEIVETFNRQFGKALNPGSERSEEHEQFFCYIITVS